jgi:LAO/AO transport system kinase
MSSPTKAQREQCQQPRPDWVPGDAGAAFATWIMQGVSPSGVVREVKTPPKRRTLMLADYVDGIRRRDTTVLARAITLVESNAPTHQELAQQLLTKVLPQTGGAMRVGITGIPGVGKSTFIEALGSRLCDRGRRVAVLAVDPSSTLTGGSILADKIRMEKLSRHPGAFIRPSPSGGSLGGVARKTREALLLCEAAGYDVVIVETVGVGQNEVTVRSLVDCFVMLTIAGTGDEMQGMKKGVMELADLIVVNKAEEENRLKSMATRAELAQVLHYLRPATEGWATPAVLASAKTGDGIGDVWQQVEAFFKSGRQCGVLAQRRRTQAVSWMHGMIQEAVMQEFFRSAEVRAKLPELESEVAAGRMPPLAAVRALLEKREGKAEGRNPKAE